MKTSWRLLKDAFRLHLQKTSSRHFQDVFKTSCKKVLKAYSRHQKIFKKSCQDVFKTSIKCLQDAFKASSRCLAKMSSRRFQDVFKRYYQVKPFLLTSLRDVFNTFSRRTAKKVIYRRICLGHASEKFMISVQNLTEL